MKLIIDIDEEQFTTLNAKTQAEVKTVLDYGLLVKAIKNGTPVSTEGDLISRRELMKHTFGGDWDGVGFSEEYVLVSDILNAPTVEERSQGEWLKYGDHAWKCSKCSCLIHVRTRNFCPDCGADMRGKGE